MRNKLVCLLIVVLLLSAGSVASQGAQSARFDISAGEVVPGETVEVAVTLTLPAGMTAVGVDFILGYEPAWFTLVDTNVYCDILSDGAVRFMWDTASSGLTGVNTLLTITLLVSEGIPDGTYPVSFQLIELYDDPLPGGDLPFTVNSTALVYRSGMAEFSVVTDMALGWLTLPAGKVAPWNTVSVGVNERDGRLKGGILYYTFTPEGQSVPLTRPLYKRDPNADNSFTFVMPYSDVRITGETVDLDSSAADAGENNLVVFGASVRRPSDTEDAGLKFGARAYNRITVDGVQYQRGSYRMLIIRKAFIGSAAPPCGGTWADWLSEYDSEGLSWKLVTLPKVLELCEQYLDFTAHVGDISEENYDEYYVAVASVIYEPVDGGESLLLESPVSRPASWREIDRITRMEPGI